MLEELKAAKERMDEVKRRGTSTMWAIDTLAQGVYALLHWAETMEQRWQESEEATNDCASGGSQEGLP